MSAQDTIERTHTKHRVLFQDCCQMQFYRKGSEVKFYEKNGVLVFYKAES